MCEEESSFETLQLCEDQPTQINKGAIAVPIYPSSSYVFKNSDHASNLREYLFKYKWWKYYRNF